MGRKDTCLMGKKSDDKGFQGKAHAGLGKARLDTGPQIDPPYADPWDGKKRLAAEPKSLRVPFTEDEIRERRVELEKRIAQTPLLRDQCNAARDAAKVAKDALSAHISQSEGFSAITKQGWQYQDVDCVTVLSGAFAVTYRTDTGEEISRREATAADVQDSIPGV
mgnify:CR=1 FL=1